MGRTSSQRRAGLQLCLHSPGQAEAEAKQHSQRRTPANHECCAHFRASPRHCPRLATPVPWTSKLLGRDRLTPARPEQAGHTHELPPARRSLRGNPAQSSPPRSPQSKAAGTQRLGCSGRVHALGSPMILVMPGKYKSQLNTQILFFHPYQDRRPEMLSSAALGKGSQQCFRLQLFRAATPQRMLPPKKLKPELCYDLEGSALVSSQAC